MSIPYTRSLRVTAEGGTPLCVVLGAPFRGFLERLIIKQTGGGLDGFDVDVLDRKDACDSETSLSTNPDDGNTLQSKELHKIVPTIEISAPTDVYEGFGLQRPYANQDEQDPTSRRPTMAIYLDLQADGAGPKDFEIAYTITNAMD